MDRRFGVPAVALLLALSMVAVAGAQRRGRWFGGAIRRPTPESFDGRFNFCRIAFSYSSNGDGGGWSVDYPRADINLSVRLSELTKTSISTDASGEPNHLVIRLTDPELFQCPFIMMTEVGAVYFSPEEAQRLREYLLKGGFLWADDFWGSYAWENWASEFSKVLPPNEYPMRDLPRDHPMFRTQFTVDHVPQIPVDQPLVRHRWHLGARSRQRRTARARGHRQQRPAAGPRHLQHGSRRLVGARGRRQAVLLYLLGERLRVRHQRAAVRDDALRAAGSRFAGSRFAGSRVRGSRACYRGPSRRRRISFRIVSCRSCGIVADSRSFSARVSASRDSTGCPASDADMPS